MDRGVKIVAISADPVNLSRDTEAKYSYVKVVSDPDLSFGEALGSIHLGAPRQVKHEILAPGMLLIDKLGKILWMYRGTNLNQRLAPATVLQHIDDAKS